ncbi:hypothetical protein ACLVWQ_18315 [Streptomyces sp. CWNU-52B]|uniref:hypothetical protein n=1 Tax=unclassified Streptomyces TaxID=2593676 RepID=UPI0039C38E69
MTGSAHGLVGRAWDADPGHLRALTPDESLSPLLAEVNSRSRQSQHQHQSRPR